MRLLVFVAEWSSRVELTGLATYQAKCRISSGAGSRPGGPPHRTPRRNRNLMAIAPILRGAACHAWAAAEAEPESRWIELPGSTTRPAALAARRPCLRRRASAQRSVADGAGARRDPVDGADFLEIRAVIQSGSQTKGISLTGTCPPPIERVRRGVVRVRGLDVRRGTKTDRWGRGATWTP